MQRGFGREYCCSAFLFALRRAFLLARERRISFPDFNGLNPVAIGTKRS